jgi:hypothetical protein
MTKITTVGATASADGPWQPDNPNTIWFVDGVAYTDNAAFIAYFSRTSGFTVAAGDPDANHLAAVAKLKDQAARTSYHSGVTPDASDPARRNYFK